MDFWKSKDTLFLLKVFVIGFALILLSKWIDTLHTVGDAYHLLGVVIGLLFKEGGVAFMIAAVLGYTVEAISRAKQKKEIDEFRQLISEDVLSAVFKKIVPDPIFKEIKGAVLEQTIIKKNATLTCDLLTLSENDITELGLRKVEADGYLKCEMTSRYELINLSHVPIDSHTVRCATSCDLNGEFYKHLKVHGVIIKEAIEQEKVEAALTPTSDGRISYSHDVHLNGKETIQVCFCYTTYKRVNDAEVWATVLPTENMTLYVNYPEGIVVGAMSQHSSPLQVLPINQNTNRVGYELRQGIFPYQGISYWWRKS